jgi:hypothetical protein
MPEDAPVTTANGLLTNPPHLDWQRPHVNGVLPEPLGQCLRVRAPPLPIEHVCHHFHHDDIIVFSMAIGGGPQPFGGRAHVSRQTVESVCQLESCLGERRHVTSRRGAFHHRQEQLNQHHGALDSGIA